MNKLGFINEELQRRDFAHQRRALKHLSPSAAASVTVNGRQMIDFSSNDYLGLARHPLLIERAKLFADRFGTGATSSRLISGAFDCMLDVEGKLARLKSAEATLLMSTGYQCNVSLIPSLADHNTVIFSDELNHNSIIQGIKLAGCDKIIYSHNNLDQLESSLAENLHRARKIIITESVFSMDGDSCNIDRIKQLSDRFNALLIVDEAHATGVLGEGGMGLTVGKSIDVTIGTFGKALGSFGAYVATSSKIREYLINCCPGFIYTTALPPTVIGAIDAALDLVPSMDEERLRLQQNAQQVRRTLQEQGYQTGASCTQIIPVLIGDEQQTLALSQRLDAAGILATAIRPPTVPAGGSRIRLALSAAHTQQHIGRLLDTFAAAR
jgi:8-amino-7-oxononanoate synthase